MRTATVERKTRETEIAVSLDLDGAGDCDIDTGIGFLDHMLESFGRHSMIDLKVRAQGDLHVDYHHTTEDTGIVIGQAVKKALGDFAGITRFGSALIPMDETLTRVAIDVSNRPYLDLAGRRAQAEAGRNGHRAVQGVVPGLRPARRASACMSRISMARTATTSWKAASRASRGRCARRLRRTSGWKAGSPRPRARSGGLRGIAPSEVILTKRHK